jgi:hypothetical protein
MLSVKGVGDLGVVSDALGVLISGMISDGFTKPLRFQDESWEAGVQLDLRMP